MKELEAIRKETAAFDTYYVLTVRQYESETKLTVCSAQYNGLGLKVDYCTVPIKRFPKVSEVLPGYIVHIKSNLSGVSNFAIVGEL